MKYAEISKEEEQKGRKRMKKCKKKEPSRLGMLSILSVSMMGMGYTIITPALATLAAHYEGKNVSFIQTLSTLGMVVGSLIAGAVMGKRIKMRTLAILGNASCLVLGILPLFFDCFPALLADRLLFGIFLGLLYPLGNALTMRFYEGDKRSSMLGFGTMAMNFGGIVFQQMGGILAARNWQYIFLGHLFYMVSLVLSFFLPKEQKTSGGKKKEAADMLEEKLDIRSVVFISVLLLVFQMLNMSVMMIASSLFLKRNAGGSETAAFALTLYTVSGTAAGFVFGKVFQALKRYMFFVDFLFVSIGAAVIFVGQTAFVMNLGYMLIGVGYNWIWSGMVVWAGMKNPPSVSGKATSIIAAMKNFGGFLCSFWMIILGQGLERIILADIILGVALAVFLLFVNPFREKKNCQSVCKISQ